MAFFDGIKETVNQAIDDSTTTSKEVRLWARIMLGLSAVGTLFTAMMWWNNKDKKTGRYR